MKKLLILFVWMCIALTSQSQNLPQGIAYQAVAIKEGERAIAGQNPTQLYWANKDIQVRFTIFEKYPGGSNQYSESHATKTDDYGVFNLVIGQGNVISGDFTKIAWELGSAHLQVEIDFDNNGTYKLTSLERFWSVPYAFVTRKSSSTSTDSALNALNSKFNYLKNRDKDTVIGNEGGVSYKSLDSLNKILVAKLAAIKTSDKDTVVGNEWQKLSRNNDTLVLSDGGGKVTLRDEDPKNELQILSRNKDTVMLSQNGGRFVLNDDDPKNELQDLIFKNDSIFLKNSTVGISVLSIRPRTLQTDFGVTELNPKGTGYNYLPAGYAFSVTSDSVYYLNHVKKRNSGFTEIGTFGIISADLKTFNSKYSYKSDIEISSDYLYTMNCDVLWDRPITDSGRFFVLSNKYGVIEIDPLLRKTTSTANKFPSTKNITSIFSKVKNFDGCFFKDTLYLLFSFNTSLKKHFFKYSLKDDQLIFIDSSKNYSYFSKVGTTLFRIVNYWEESINSFTISTVDLKNLCIRNFSFDFPKNAAIGQQCWALDDKSVVAFTKNNSALYFNISNKSVVISDKYKYGGDYLDYGNMSPNDFLPYYKNQTLTYIFPLPSSSTAASGCASGSIRSFVFPRDIWIYKVSQPIFK